jgi:site-specific recombinase XerC
VHREVISRVRSPNPTRLKQLLEEEIFNSLGAVLGEDFLAKHDGQQVLLDSDWMGDSRDVRLLNQFFSDPDFRQKSKRTQGAYALKLRRMLVFTRLRATSLEPQSTTLVDWDRVDIDDFQTMRCKAESVRPTTWDGDVKAMTMYFNWLVFNQELSHRPWRSNLYKNVKDTRIRSIPRLAYLGFRDLGMRRLSVDPDAEQPTSRTALRDSAFSDTLVTTGARCEEANSLFTIEIPELTSGRHAALMPICAAISKGRMLSRAVEIPAFALQRIRAYRMTERATAVAENQLFLRHCLEEGRLILVTKFEHQRLELKIPGGEPQHRHIDDLEPEIRARLVHLNAKGQIDPLCIWLGVSTGLPLTAHSWSSDIFPAACDRAQTALLASPTHRSLAIHVTPHRLRHTFGVAKLRALTKAARDLEAEIQEATKQGNRSAVARLTSLMFDPFERLRELLGHSNPNSTIRYIKELRAIETTRAAATAIWADSWEGETDSWRDSCRKAESD